MLDIFKSWYKRYFSNPEAIILLLVLVVIFGLWILVGEIFAPVIVSLVIAYLLGWWINLLVNHNIPRNFAYLIIYYLLYKFFCFRH
jgi:putative permease